MKTGFSRRQTTSQESYWQRLFNSYACHSEDHLISGWSREGWQQRMAAYFTELKAVGLPEGSLVLDLGCGSGSYCRILAERGYRTVGMDYARKVVFEAKKRSSEEKGRYLCGTIHHLPFQDNVFDHVLCIGVFQSLMQYLEALVEIKRVLAVDAPLLIMTLNRWEITTVVKRILGSEERIFINSKPVPRLNTYDPRVFRRELEKVGFYDIKLMPLQIFPGSLVKFSGFIRNCWDRMPFLPYLTAHTFVVRAYKGES